MSSVSCVASTAPWPAPRMVGMAVRDQRLVDRPRRVDVEAAALAAHAGRRRRQDVFGTHGAQICHIGALRIRAACAVQPLFVSSGDLIADRRYELGARLSRPRAISRRPPTCYAQAVELAPGFAVGLVRARRDRASGSATATARSPRSGRRATPIREDRHGARLHLARLGAADGTPAMPRPMCARCSTSMRRASTAR